MGYATCFGQMQSKWTYSNVVVTQCRVPRECDQIFLCVQSHFDICQRLLFSALHVIMTIIFCYIYYPTPLERLQIYEPIIRWITHSHLFGHSTSHYHRTSRFEQWRFSPIECWRHLLHLQRAHVWISSAHKSGIQLKAGLKFRDELCSCRFHPNPPLLRRAIDRAWLNQSNKNIRHLYRNIVALEWENYNWMMRSDRRGVHIKAERFLLATNIMSCCNR